MFRITTLTSFKRHLLIGAVLAGIIVPAAGAETRPPDVQDTASASLAAQLSPPDIRDAALSTSVATEDVLERYASAHPFGAGLSAANLGASRPPDVRDAALGSSIPVPDVVERYATAHGYLGGPSQQLSVPRPPDVAATGTASRSIRRCSSARHQTREDACEAVADGAHQSARSA